MGGKRFLIFLLLIIFPAAALFPFSWPVSEPLVTSTFGTDKWGTFGSGIEIYGNGVAVRPSSGGEVIFYEEASGHSRIPSGLGGFAVVEHDRKLRTLYSSMDLADDIASKTSVNEADILGEAGSSGKSVKPHLYFAVIDSEFEQYVNPLLLLNTIADTRAPVIRNIGIRSETGYIPVEKNAVVRAGKAEVVAEIFDPCMSDEFNCTMAPFKIYLFHNGEEIFYVNFESLRPAADGAVIQSRDELQYADYYLDDGRISFGEILLAPGDSRFEILVSDYTGNESGSTFRLTVVE